MKVREFLEMLKVRTDLHDLDLKVRRGQWPTDVVVIERDEHNFGYGIQPRPIAVIETLGGAS